MAADKEREKAHDPRQEAVQAVISQIEKTYGKGSIMRLGADMHAELPGISTGSLSLDIALGGRGVPRGRVVEIFGHEASGKTTLCLTIVSHAQKAGGMAAYIDAEHALDPAYARRIGVNLEDLLLSQPDSGEQALEIAELLVRSNAVDVIIVDSVAALVPKAELEGEMGDSHVGLQARLMSQALRKLTHAISKSSTCVIFTNQIRLKIGVMYGNPETTPGGLALKFYSSVRVETRRVAQIKNEGEEVLGNRVRATVVKNKVAPPFRRCEFDIMFNQGISREGDIVDLGVEKEIIDRSGNWLSFKGTKLGPGREKAKEFLRENKDVAQAITKEILKAVGEQATANGFAPPAPPADARPADAKAAHAGQGTSAASASAPTAILPPAHKKDDAKPKAK